jgi:hypothetical protein
MQSFLHKNVQKRISFQPGLFKVRAVFIRGQSILLLARIAAKNPFTTFSVEKDCSGKPVNDKEKPK